MRGLVIILIILFSGEVYSQEIALRSFVKEDTVQLRWAPTSMNLLREGLRDGYFVQLNNETITILPFDHRKKEYLNSPNQRISDLAAIVDQYMQDNETVSDKDQFLYALWMLSAGPNREIAKLFGLYYEVLNQESIRCSIELKKSEVKSNELQVSTSTKDENPNMTVLEGSNPKKRKEVYLKWEVESLSWGYSAYNIWKSEDSVQFTKINNVPLIFMKSEYEKDKIHMDFVDTLVESGQQFYYYVEGINHFGDPGQKSNVVAVYVPHSLNGWCQIDSVFAQAKNRLVQGEYFPPENSKEQVQEFALFRSDSMNFGYQQLASNANENGKFNFSSTSKFLSGDRHYYKVAAVSVDNDTSWSYPYYFFTLDQEPPSKPVGLVGSINDSGIVFLNWKANPENDIRGYRVFKANSLREEFMEMTSYFVEDSSWLDTLSLNNLTSEVYYKISAVDQNYNNSPFSDWIELLKPDTIPPVPAVLKSYNIDSSGISLRWVNSSSDDWARANLIRLKDSEFDSILNWSNDSVNSYTDNTLDQQGSYCYIIYAYDKAGNQSESSKLYVNYELGYRIFNSKLVAIVDRREKEIKLSWEPQTDVYSIKIYRKKNDGNFRLLKTVYELSEDVYVDEDLSINNNYSYKIQVTYSSGHSSKLSDAVTVEY